MKTFEELGVSPEIRRAIEEMGYEQPMPVQEEVIPYLLGENNDVVALAQTGTGKTAAFGLPLIQKINVNNRIPQSLILCPTRELCLQIAGDLNDYSKYTDGLRVLPVYGGSSIESQIRALKRSICADAFLYSPTTFSSRTSLSNVSTLECTSWEYL